MKALGIVRKIDELGRVVIPMEVRRANGWETNQLMEMFADNNGGLYMKAYGKEEEKKEILLMLEHLQQTTTNDVAREIATKTIQFINN